MMKTIILSLFLCYFYVPSFAFSDYATGQELHNWAISGLNLRTQPDAKSSKVLNIPFGESVKVIDTQLKAHPFSYTMASGNSSNWTVDGHWVKIQYQEQEGYVFDGYLSRLPVLTNGPDHNPYFSLDLIKSYGEKNWGGLEKEVKENTFHFDIVDPDKAGASSYTLYFKNGSKYEDVNEGMSGYVSIFIKNISLVEAYLLFNALTGYENKMKKNGKSNGFGNGIKLSSQKKGELHFIGDGMSSMNIQKVRDGVIIQSGGGC